MHETSFSKIEDFRDKYLSVDDNIEIIDIYGLTKDVSCKFIFSENLWNYKSVMVDINGNLEEEIDDESIDVVVTGQTFERVKSFWVLVSEIGRILKPGGYFCGIVSSSGVFSPRGDFYRFHPDALDHLVCLAGLKTVECTVDPMNIWRDAKIVARKDAS